MWESEHNEGWTPGIDAFMLWCWSRLLRVLWTARRSNQSIPKEICPEYSLEGWMLKLKLQYFGYLMRRTDSLEKTLMLGKIEVRRRREWQGMRWLDGITDWWTWVLATPRSLWWTGSLAWCSQWVAKSRTWLSNWGELNIQVPWGGLNSCSKQDAIKKMKKEKLAN